MNRILTPQENQYVSILANRVLTLSRQVDEVSRLPLTDVYEATGLPVGKTLTLLLRSMDVAECEMRAALGVKER